jgi:hypothetical protein
MLAANLTALDDIFPPGAQVDLWHRVARHSWIAKEEENSVKKDFP